MLKLKEVKFEHDDDNDLIILWLSEYERLDREEQKGLISTNDIGFKKLKNHLLDFIQKHKL